MGHSIIEKELEQEQTLVVEVGILLLSENLLGSVALLIRLLVDGGACRWTIKHVDERGFRHVNHCNIVKNSMSVLVDDKDFLMHCGEELLVPIGAVIFQELHQLCLVNQV